MASKVSSLLRRGKELLTPGASSDSLGNGFTTAPEGKLFPSVDPAIDGEDCLQDCASCTIHLPAKWEIDEDEKLYGQVKGWGTHMLVATGKTDWVRDVEDEKGTVMEAMKDCGVKPSNGRLMLSASNMPMPSGHHEGTPASQPTTVLLLPSFTIIENVTPASVPELIRLHIDPASTTSTPLVSPTPAITIKDTDADVSTTTNGHTVLSTNPDDPPSTPPQPLMPTLAPSIFYSRPCPHAYLILLCSQRTRDARCGQSAPLLRREFERHLRPLSLYRDLNDSRPNGVGIYFISHVGGHKFAANVMVYRRDASGEGGQCIWLARVRPEDCEGIVKFTVLQ
ncbi:hypothetical protein MMC12_007017, partial [Toensbergia leucococca]|nr:hypothetical protein [Toensbergia leucococca]